MCGLGLSVKGLNGMRLMKIKNKKDLLKRFDDYLAFCARKDNEEVVNLSGFASYNGTCRDYLNQLQCDKPAEFDLTVKSIIDKIANITLNKAFRSEKNQALSIFLLKNYGYTDKTETDLNVKGNIGIEKLFNDIDKKPKDK